MKCNKPQYEANLCIFHDKENCNSRIDCSNKVACPECKGDGLIYTRGIDAFGNQIVAKCYHCGGEGFTEVLFNHFT